MTTLFQELGSAAPPTAELLTHSALVAIFLLLYSMRQCKNGVLE